MIRPAELIDGVLESDDRPFIVLTETKPSKRHIPVWARYSLRQTLISRGSGGWHKPRVWQALGKKKIRVWQALKRR